MDKLGEVIDSVIQMSNLEEKANKKYKEILVLDKMLTDSHIPHKKETMFGGWHICYPSKEDTICSVIEHDGSYGRSDDLIEIMGLLTDEEREYGDAVGGLTAEDVFERIKKHYESEVNNASGN